MTKEKSLRETIDRLNNKIVKGQDIAHELKQDVERVEAQVKRRDAVITEQGEKIKESEKEIDYNHTRIKYLSEQNDDFVYKSYILNATKAQDKANVKETVGLLLDGKNKRDEMIEGLEKENKELLVLSSKKYNDAGVGDKEYLIEQLSRISKENTELKAKVEYGNTGDKNTAELVTKVAKTQTKKYKNLQEERDLLREQISALMEVNFNLRKYSDAVVTEKNHKIDGLIQDKKDCMVLEKKLDWKKLENLINGKGYTKEEPEYLPGPPPRIVRYKESDDPNGNFSDTGGDDYSDCIWADRLRANNNNFDNPHFYRVDLTFKNYYNNKHHPYELMKYKSELRAKNTMRSEAECELLVQKEITKTLQSSYDEQTKHYNEALHKIDEMRQSIHFLTKEVKDLEKEPQKYPDIIISSRVGMSGKDKDILKEFKKQFDKLLK